MKKAIRHTSASLALMGAILGTSAEGLAFCDLSSSGYSDYSSRAIGYALGQPAIDAYFANEFRDHYRLVNDAGWDLIPTELTVHDTNERTKFVLASYLIWTGVRGDTPQAAEQVVSHPSLGLGWGYDPHALRISPTFHRSGDEWGPLTSDFNLPLCTKINFFTGERSCGSGGTATMSDLKGNLSTEAMMAYFEAFTVPMIGFYDTKVTWGKPTITAIDDVSPRGDTARFKRTSWTQPLSANATYEIAYYCKAFERSASSLASYIVHENWHGTVAPDHVGYTNWIDPTDSGGCDIGQERCDIFNWSEPTNHSHRWEERGLWQLATGAYQVQHRFLCDLVQGPTDWVPDIVSVAAEQWFEREMEKGRFVNLSSERVPYDCPLPTSHYSDILASSCPTTTCTTNADCPFSGSCFAGCCVTIR